MVKITSIYPVLIAVMGLSFGMLLPKKNIAQEYFSQYSIGKKLADEVHYTSQVRGYFKHTYQNPNWSRVGSDIDFGYRRGLFKINGGLEARLTYDEEIDDYFEVRPWLKAGFVYPLTATIDFNQYVKEESRNIIYRGSSIENQNTWRTRFKSTISMELFMTEGSNKGVVIKLGGEWYVNSGTFAGERFQNSSEYTLAIKRVFESSNSLTFTYGFESYKNEFSSSDNNGNTFYLTYWFR